MPFSNCYNKSNTTASNNSAGTADNTVLGHAKYGEMMACYNSVASGAGHHQPLVRGKPGTLWPCRGVRDVGIITDDLVHASPQKLGYLLRPNKEAAPLYLVGYIGGDSVCKSINTLVTGDMPAPYQWCWPAFMPGLFMAGPGAANM